MAAQPPLSRLAFDPEGRVLHGPALKDLEQRDL